MCESIPTNRELEALKVLWEHGEATVRQICDTINAKGEELAYTTVLSLLQVMEQKGLVGHKRIGKAYTYSPRVRRERTSRRLAADFLERVFDGAVDQFVVHALESRRVSEEDLNRLEQMIADARKRSRPPTKKGPQE